MLFHPVKEITLPCHFIITGLANVEQQYIFNEDTMICHSRVRPSRRGGKG